MRIISMLTMLAAFILPFILFADSAEGSKQKPKTPKPDKKPSGSQSSESANLTESVLAAQKWLSLLDKEKYSESWDTGSQLFQQTIPKEEWQKVMDAIRKPLGKVSSRDILDQRTANNPKGLPVGEYIVLFYNTSFAGKPAAHELVTLIKESNGQWKVLTYQVQ